MPRVSNKLTDLKVRQLKKPGRYPDGGSLYVQVTTSGSVVHRSFLFRYMLRGRSREMGLGAYTSENGLAEARAAAAKARDLCRRGIDPIGAREAEKAAQAVSEAKGMSFQQCAEQFVDAHRSGWRNSKHAAQWEASLKAYAYPKIGHLPVSAIDLGLVHDVLAPIWKKKTETASRVRGRIEAVLDWATVKQLRDGPNPARWKGCLDKLLPRRSKVQKVVHHPAIPYVELPAFMAKLRATEGTAARALEFTILTAARTGEVIGARLAEVKTTERLWVVPGGRMKAGKEHRVPLSARAVAALKAVERMDADTHLFPGRRAGTGLSNMTLLKLLERMERDDLTVHGFRSTFRDWAAERTNYPREVVEMALAHALESKVEAAYLRADLFEKRRRLMDEWARYCASPAAQGRILPLRAKR